MRRDLRHRNNPHSWFVKASDQHAKAFATECGINTNSCCLLLIRSTLVASSQIQSVRRAGFLFQYIVQSSFENGKHEVDSRKHNALASRPGVVVNVTVEGKVYLVGKEQVIKSILKGGGIAAWVLRPRLQPPTGRFECNINIASDPEDSVQNLQAQWYATRRP